MVVIIWGIAKAVAPAQQETVSFRLRKLLARNVDLRFIFFPCLLACLLASTEIKLVKLLELNILRKMYRATKVSIIL